ncbi:alpha/beta hydrolase [Sphingomonas sp.]|uniref:alpha/beta fold hydrolase n=1 Tax=Sphingomonas sp. TaxID=28214 RepID=UPI00286E7DB7|nr:alpha/beta hydrolase [Sphingomonas sp.]
MNRFVIAACALALLGLAAPASSAAPGKLLTVNGIQLHYQERGAGEPLLLLHGFSSCGEGDWGPLANELAKTNRVILVDLRGHGWSTNPSGQFTMRQSAEDIRGLLDALGIRRVRAMGISAGGMTLLHLATKYPERVDAMVVIGATTYFTAQTRKALGEIATQPLPREIADGLSKCASRGEGQVKELMRQFVGFKDSYEDMNLTPPYLATIKARTLIVHGDRDEFFPVAIPVEMYAAIPGSQLWIVPNGDHVPIYGGRSAEFLRITRAFLGNGQRKAD